MIFLCGKDSRIGFRQLTKGAVVLEPEWLKTRQMILDKLHELVVKADGNVPALRKHIAQHLDGLWNVYKNKEFERKQINVWKERDPKKFESIHVIDLQLIYATCTTNRHIASIIIKTDGIGLRDYQPLSNMAVIGIK